MEKVDIRFFDDFGEYAGRFWSHVPRVGDEIMLNAGKGFAADSSGKTAFVVERVVWGVEGTRDRHQCVNIKIKLAPPTGRAALAQEKE